MNTNRDSDHQRREPRSLWPDWARGLWATVHEFPLASFLVLATGIGFLAPLRYLAGVGYPLREAAILASKSSLAFGVLASLALALTVMVCAPLFLQRARPEIRVLRWEVAGVQAAFLAWLLALSFAMATWQQSFWPGSLAGLVVVTLVLARAGLHLYRQSNTTARKTGSMTLMICSLGACGLFMGIESAMRLVSDRAAYSSLVWLLIALALSGVAIAGLAWLVQAPGAVAFGVPAACVLLTLFIGATASDAVTKRVATLAGLRIEGAVDLMISTTDCKRFQRLAEAATKQEGAQGEPWRVKECPPEGARIRARVPVIDRRWLVELTEQDGQAAPKSMELISIADENVQLILPADRFKGR